IMLRTGEIGTSMALGVTRRGIMRLFLSEGILLGCIGGFLGLIVGLLLAHVLSSIGIPMSPPPGLSRGFTGQILVTWDIVLDSLALTVGTTFLASVYPAWKASRMQIVDALRHNR
ncbi:MAG: FtsX-like permease family protein, partial [Pseudomonadota bacterium]|nr:FtsX-like permease family protein [Pseudomonadota bacterium]